MGYFDRKNNFVPSDWITCAYPHELGTYEAGLFGWKKIITCTCGLTGMGTTYKGAYQELWQLHCYEEAQARHFFEGMRRQIARRESSYTRTIPGPRRVR